MPRPKKRKVACDPADLPPPPPPEIPRSPPKTASLSQGPPAPAVPSASPDKEGLAAAAVVVKSKMAEFREAQTCLERQLRLQEAGKKVLDIKTARLQKRIASKCPLKAYNGLYALAEARLEYFDRREDFHSALADYHEAKIAALGAKIACKDALIKRLKRHKRARARMGR